MIRNDGIKFSVTYWAICCFIALLAMNFAGMFYYIIFGTFVFYLIANKRIQIDQHVIWYVLLTLVFSFHSLGEGSMGIARKSIHLMLYVLGFDSTLSISKCAPAERKMQEKWLNACIFAIALGFWIHLMLNYAINFGTSIQRNTIDIWTGDIRAATGQTSYAIFMIATGIVLFLMPKQKSERWFALIALCGILAYNMMLAGRTILMLMLVILCICFLYLIINRRIPKKVRNNALLAIIVITLVVVVVWWFDIGGIKNVMTNSNLIERFDEVDNADELLEDGRVEKRANYLKHMLEYPWGGLNLRRQYGYAHDLLLDGYDEYGIVMLFVLIGIVVDSITAVVRMLKLRYLDYRTKALVGCVYTVIFIEFCLEPILSGALEIFTCYSLINGCIRGLIVSNFNSHSD